ncbi:uncharacterized protein LOC131701674 isoform X2 [Acipenser ruthenus]|uniref:uncharacterized protein LOC131701674 isoform X2 n=1 Tax=Acipenser ruthenus TaxID=7906 RepID=UPI002741363C|nr:uncharacterized protein LOC131701674 isoform X2 [Acipenser ruthenus]
MALLRQYFWLWLALGIGFVSLILGLFLTLLCWCIFKKGQSVYSPESSASEYKFKVRENHPELPPLPPRNIVYPAQPRGALESSASGYKFKVRENHPELPPLPPTNIVYPAQPRGALDKQQQTFRHQPESNPGKQQQRFSQQQSFSQQQKSSRDSELYENKETEPAYMDVFDDADYDDVVPLGFVSEDYDDIENQPPDRGFTK